MFVILEHQVSFGFYHLSVEQTLDPRTAGRSCPLTVQNPDTSCEPNTTVEISSTEVTGRQLHLCLRKWMRYENIGKMAFTAAHAEERCKCSPCKNLSHCWRSFVKPL